MSKHDQIPSWNVASARERENQNTMELYAKNDENFFRVKSHIVEVLHEFNSEDLLININFTLLNDLNIALKPITLTIETLSRKDATLVTADLAINFMMQKLEEAKSQISSNLLSNISKRIEERLNSNLMKLLKCLKDGNNVPSKEQLNLAGDLMKRLFFIDDDDKYDIITVVESDVLIQSENPKRSITMEKELYAILKNSMIEPETKNDFNKLKQEFILFRNTGKRTSNLQNLYNALLTIKPTSTDAERAFSLSANFYTKIRSRLGDQSINALLFLKCFYLNRN